MKIHTLPLLLCLLAPFACSKKDDTPSTGGTTTGGATTGGMHDDPHGAAQTLGSMTVGAHTFEITQFGDVAAGKEAVFELGFPQGKALPGTVRGWIGTEAGEGSRKNKFDKEGDAALHAHLEVPATLPAGSKLWIEIEDGGKTATGSTAWK